MNLLVISLFISVFSTDYFAQQLGVISVYWTLLPEALTGIATVVVLARFAAARGITLDWRYAAFLALFCFVLVFGFVAQSVPTGAVVAGLRNYVKFIPFFLLAAIFPFTNRQLRIQAGFLLAILFLQSPLAVYQRFVQFADKMHTGDPIRGMATTSSALSLLMVCVVALAVSLYLRRRIRLPMLLVAIGVFVLPATLNETKATLLLLPVALLAPAMFMPRGSRSLRRIVPIVAVGSLALGTYMSVYNYLIQNRNSGQELGTFFSERYVDDYLYTGVAEGESKRYGRFDSIAIAAQTISRDPLTLAVGYGAGNVSESSLPGFDGQYASYVERYGVIVTQVSHSLWEIGVIGLFCYLLFYWLAFRDARFLARTDSPNAIFGQVWATVTIIMTMALVYKSVFTMNEIAYLFWFYTGVVARQAYLARRARRHAPAAIAEQARVDWQPRRPGLDVQWN